jgi:hypothetical protein
MSGKVLSVVHIVAMKWFWKVWMARSAAFVQCIPGGIFWWAVASLTMKFSGVLEHSLSM